MKKLGYVIAALGAIAVAAPSIASAETVVIKHATMTATARAPNSASIAITAGTRAGGIMSDRVVIIKHRHHDY